MGRHKFSIVLLLILFAVFCYHLYKSSYVPAGIMVITMITVSIPVIFSIEKREKEEVCKHVRKGKCYIDDMTDKPDCTGKGHDLEHCGDYQAYKAKEEETNG